MKTHFDPEARAPRELVGEITLHKTAGDQYGNLEASPDWDLVDCKICLRNKPEQAEATSVLDQPVPNSVLEGYRKYLTELAGPMLVKELETSLSLGVIPAEGGRTKEQVSNIVEMIRAEIIHRMGK